jgi:hypothetical protein
VDDNGGASAGDELMRKIYCFGYDDGGAPARDDWGGRLL